MANTRCGVGLRDYYSFRIPKIAIGPQLPNHGPTSPGFFPSGLSLLVAMRTVFPSWHIVRPWRVLTKLHPSSCGTDYDLDQQGMLHVALAPRYQNETQNCQRTNSAKNAQITQKHAQITHLHDRPVKLSRHKLGYCIYKLSYIK